ncbi:MAG TPA: hypothetical protein DGD08_07665 [Gemmatimonas aurantiaca]|uniref:Uncharacterized protein n=2 Tax=Gemmatimonas aurantiaca TaxID=173480 RepID=A0A3D4V8W9_9BACT|nr:hypothetical protein [Gemmatimonas aurantiaca]HCT57078.1 hypothetical protein [Gemmatimonas aurantiaca]
MPPSLLIVPARQILRRALPLALLSAALMATASIGPIVAPLTAQVAPVIETALPFDSAGRITTITPSLASRLSLTAPAWPVSGGFREARLYRGEQGAAVLVVQRTDASIARYALDESAVTALSRAVEAGLVAVGRSSERLVGAGTGGTGVELSQPAGNAFVRNQTFLGLAAYGPATAALFSEGGGAAIGGGYFLGAGASFFVAARIVKNRPVTRAQALRSAHGGTRGALIGLGIAGIAGANGGAAWGSSVLAGAIGGTTAGFVQARGLSDGEAASAGLFADLAMLTTGGIAATSGAFDGREVGPGESLVRPYRHTDNSLRPAGKVAIGASIVAGVVGYALGPRYARRAAYNVTSGDAGVVLTSAMLGGVGLTALANGGLDDRAAYGAATAGVLAGALFADRVFVRRKDRTSADGALTQLGGIAGALIGAGFAAMADFEERGVAALAASGGLLGLLAADHLIAPPADAGPLRGVMPRSSNEGDSRFSLSIGPVTSLRITF